MIKINDKVLEVGHFPDGTQSLKIELSINNVYYICWNYENDTEMITLMYIVNHIKEYRPEYMSLDMPYCPNARMDRVKNYDEVFTLKYFADFINSLGFDRVSITDPHSNVCTALINHIAIKSPKEYIERVYEIITGTEGEEPLMFYPDEGAGKRYSGLISAPYVFGIKNRDWRTGKILGLDVFGDTRLIKGNNVLIVDDICSKGGTFYHSARKLKELGAKNIYLYVTHCENTILNGDLINSGLIKKIYTTDSIFTKEHELIYVL